MSDGAIGSLPRAHTSDRVTGIAIAALILLAFFLVGRQIWQVATGPLPPSPGVAAPTFSAPVLSGGETRLADHRGSVVLLDFWATWCPPCVEAMPTLEKLQNEYGPRGLIVLGLNQEPENLPRVRRFVKSYGLGFPILVDSGAIAERYAVYSFPTSLIVDAGGVVRHVFRGPASEERIRSALEPLLPR